MLVPRAQWSSQSLEAPVADAPIYSTSRGESDTKRRLRLHPPSRGGWVCADIAMKEPRIQGQVGTDGRGGKLAHE